jgi:hypothetical protein
VESNNNYNTLGRMGPIYPRPEYRPGSRSESPKPENSTSGFFRSPKASSEDLNSGAQNGGQKTKDAVKAAVSLKNTEGRLNLVAAKSLTLETAEAISQLEPLECNSGPHSALEKTAGLMAPRYV